MTAPFGDRKASEAYSFCSRYPSSQAFSLARLEPGLEISSEIIPPKMGSRLSRTASRISSPRQSAICAIL